MSKKKKKNKDAINLSKNINIVSETEEYNILKIVSITTIVILILTLICYFVEV